MNKINKILLHLELTICFVPVAFLYSMLVIFASRGKVSGFVDEILYGWGSQFYLSVKYLIVVIIGAMGLIAIVSLAIKVISPASNVISRGKLILFVCLAVFLDIAMLISVLNDKVPDIPIVISLILPLIGSFHLMYLGRRYLFNSKK